MTSTYKREGLTILSKSQRNTLVQLNARSELLGYLTQNVNYDMDDENLLGMGAYFDLAHETDRDHARARRCFYDHCSSRRSRRFKNSSTG